MSEWTLDTLKTYIDTVLKERDEQVSMALDSADKAIQKSEIHLNETLRGFPQDYTRRTEFERLQDEINKIKADHVQRREVDELKAGQEQGRGAKIVAAAGIGIVVALISVALGAMYENQLSRGDVSSQIEKEAPWQRDKADIEKRIDLLEQEVIVLKVTASLREVSPYR